MTLPARKLIVALALLSAVSAFAGGVGLILARHGSPYLPPMGVLEHTPFASFLIPGLILTIVIGGASLVCAWLAWRRSPVAADATLFAGGALSIWIIAEVAMMRELHWLHVAYGALGAAIFGLGLRACLRSPSPRQRWIALVTLAETVGFMAPASAGIFQADTDLIVAAGFIEGLVLGAGQAWAFPLPVNRWRFAALTAIGAGIAWAGVMSAILFGGALAVVAGVVALLAIGTAQWLELRRHASRAHRWILWTALAWIVALPLSFAPGPFVDEATPLASRLALFGAGGALMAYTMALITWQGARRLTPARPPAAR